MPSYQSKVTCGREELRVKEKHELSQGVGMRNVSGKRDLRSSFCRSHSSGMAQDPVG